MALCGGKLTVAVRVIHPAFMCSGVSCRLPTIPCYSMEAQTSRLYSRSQEKAGRGATRSLPHFSRASPPTQRKVRSWFIRLDSLRRITVLTSWPLFLTFFFFFNSVCSWCVHKPGRRGLHGDAGEASGENGRSGQSCGVGQSLHWMQLHSQPSYVSSNVRLPALSPAA